MTRTAWRLGGGVLALLAAGAALAGRPAPRPDPAPAATATRTAPATLPRTAALFDRYIAANKMPGIVGAFGSWDSPTIFVSAGKIADGAGAAKAGPDSLWRIYSMTKPITGIAAMLLVEDGTLKLDQPISDFIPAFRDMKVLTGPDSLASRPAARPITVRHLLTHTAGLGYHIITKGPLLKEYERLGILPAAVGPQVEERMRKVRPASLAEFADRVATLPLIADPGTKWSYSIGLDVLGRVIEVASGMSFDGFVKKRLFDPLGMRSSYWTVPRGEVPRFASNYLFVGQNRLPLDAAASSVWLTPPSFPYGGAGLVMSARDYDRFLNMLQHRGTLDGVRVMQRETADLAMSNLLPEGVAFSGAAGSPGDTPTAMGFGAGGSVHLESQPGGPGKGTYGWGGAAGTIAFVDPRNQRRWTVMVNYFPGQIWPLRAEVIPLATAELGRAR